MIEAAHAAVHRRGSTVAVLSLGTTLLTHRASSAYIVASMMSSMQSQPWRITKWYDAGCIRTRDRCGPPLRRWIEPIVTLLEEPTLLSNPISTTLGIAAAWLTCSRKGALTATVAAKGPSAVTPAGGTVSLTPGPVLSSSFQLGQGSARVSGPRRLLDRRSPAGTRGRRPAVRPVARSGDLATTWSLLRRFQEVISGPFLTDVSATGNSEARTAGTDCRLVREVISTTGVFTFVAGNATDDRTPRARQRRRAARRSRIAFSVPMRFQLTSDKGLRPCHCSH